MASVLALVVAGVVGLGVWRADDHHAVAAVAGCLPSWMSPTARPPAGVRARVFRGRYYELGRVAHPRGVMVMVHGGGWWKVGPGRVSELRPEAAFWRRRGWDTYNVDYAACTPRAIGNVVAFYDLARRAHPRLPVCLVGGSAGGQLALMVAARRDPACVIGEAAPTDLRSVVRQFPPAAPARARKLVRYRAVNAFGRRRLAAMSPVTHAAQITSPVLLAGAADDPIVPLAQARELARRLPARRGEVRVLAPGRFAPFVHAKVSRLALRRFRGVELRFARRAARRWRARQG